MQTLVYFVPQQIEIGIFMAGAALISHYIQALWIQENFIVLVAIEIKHHVGSDQFCKLENAVVVITPLEGAQCFIVPADELKVGFLFKISNQFVCLPSAETFGDSAPDRAADSILEFRPRCRIIGLQKIVHQFPNWSLLEIHVNDSGLGNCSAVFTVQSTSSSLFVIDRVPFACKEAVPIFGMGRLILRRTFR